VNQSSGSFNNQANVVSFAGTKGDSGYQGGGVIR